MSYLLLPENIRNSEDDKKTDDKSQSKFCYNTKKEDSVTLFNSNRMMCTIEVSERCLLYMLLSNTLNFQMIAEIDELPNTYSFPKCVLNDKAGQQIHETWYSMCKLAKKKLEDLDQYKDKTSSFFHISLQ